MCSTNMGNKEKISIEENFLQMRKEREDKQKERQKKWVFNITKHFFKTLR